MPMNSPLPPSCPARLHAASPRQIVEKLLGLGLVAGGLLATVSCAQGTELRDSSSQPTPGVVGASPAGLNPPTADPAGPSPKDLPDTVDFSETPVGKNGKLSVVGTQLLNADGNPVQLRGVSSMWLNWENTGYATSYASLQWMRDNWNVSVIRAAMGTSSDKGDPVQGGYLASPERMEKQVTEIVDNATQLGVYAIIDWHGHHSERYTEEAQDFFARMAARYADNDNVFYETYNEPYDAKSWPNEVKPYHEAVIGSIRAQDDDGIIILGSPRWSQDVDVAAQDPVEGSNLMYTLHFYSCTHGQYLLDKAQRAIDMGLALFVTEWGATHADGGVSDKSVCSDEADRWHQLMDANGISSAAWKLDDCGDTSCFFKERTKVGGDEYDEGLQGHGAYVVSKLKAPAPAL